MFYKSVLEQMHSVLLMNLYIYRPICGDENAVNVSGQTLVPMVVLSTSSCHGN